MDQSKILIHLTRISTPVPPRRFPAPRAVALPASAQQSDPAALLFPGSPRHLRFDGTDDSADGDGEAEVVSSRCGLGLADEDREGEAPSSSTSSTSSPSSSSLSCAGTHPALALAAPHPRRWPRTDAVQESGTLFFPTLDELFAKTGMFRRPLWVRSSSAAAGSAPAASSSPATVLGV